MNSKSKTHLLLIPSYNTGTIVVDVIKTALQFWQPVLVVVDGSDDGSAELLEKLAQSEANLNVLKHLENQGKGSAVYTGIKVAEEQGYTHVLMMDADDQHPANLINRMMELSIEHPKAMILGKPIFDESAPASRVHGRKISNFWANLETLWAGIHDSLFGFRVYPIKALLEVMDETRFARRFDFDPEVVVRLVWKDVPIINTAVPVRYLSAEEGGVSQFRYLRDNCLLTAMHIRLFFGFLIRIPVLLWRVLNAASKYSD
jgi:glycosyltransferase involved in cell wall biosynthesis